MKVKKTAEVTKFKIRCSRVRLCEHDYGEEREWCIEGGVAFRYISIHHATCKGYSSTCLDVMR